jgi:hypothetical protein
MKHWRRGRRAATPRYEHERKLDLLRGGAPTGDPTYDGYYDQLRRAGLEHTPSLVVMDTLYTSGPDGGRYWV